ncbi:uncharacterized protein BO97DRAFT_407467 [Aspergillus homomorphus CBS 101889]|uniref:Uncharacterized protein n=1 Tax=Aspergillus homomorphus (strain CBS 101889) TaxID=1450537 RepID=A0A395HQ18_ASPHC|nr:hypothetical protein BO97DRAFT_407467 [Aspergillus homomorphus CBS 101889]RAL09706.1 hypothetical protein BO97DRAFT_407467 [Aspergillus homomorphus CBS 101889]
MICKLQSAGFQDNKTVDLQRDRMVHPVQQWDERSVVIVPVNWRSIARKDYRKLMARLITKNGSAKKQATEDWHGLCKGDRYQCPGLYDPGRKPGGRRAFDHCACRPRKEKSKICRKEGAEREATEKPHTSRTQIRVGVNDRYGSESENVMQARTTESSEGRKRRGKQNKIRVTR